ncbi:MAG: ion transporter [Spirochaetales bacterium]|nr:ion transporter [Spirochaetales bacterium]
MKKKGSFLESLVMTAIFLVLVQTFLEDWSVVVGWSWGIRRILTVTGFGFDVFFTLEFLIRLYFAVYRGRVKDYIFHERGWIDFLASVPLLLLNSGPSVLTLWAGETAAFALGGSLNVLKVVKAIRIARILRLLRTLKIFKHIKNAESVMAQRHVTKVATIATSMLVFGLFLFTLLSAPLGFPSAEDLFNAEKETIIRNIPPGAEKNPEVIKNYAATEESLLLIKYRGQTVYTRYDNHYYDQWYGPGDYDYTLQDSWEFFFDNSQVAAVNAKMNLMFFFIVVVLVLAYLLLYGPHFALTISDPIHVMRRGLEEQSYNLEVKIPQRYKDDDVYRLSALYNEVYLPLKDRTREQDGQTGSLDLKMEDLGNLFDQE